MRQIRMADVLATVLTLAAAGLYVVWASGLGFTAMSTRDVALTVFVLGFAGCLTDQTRMVDVYGAAGHARSPLWYVVVGSAFGAIALVAGVVAIGWSSKVGVGVMTVALVLLWVLATGRHTQRVPADRERRGKVDRPDSPALRP